MRKRRMSSLVTGGVLLIAACGSTSPNDPVAQPAPVTSVAPTESGAQSGDTASSRTPAAAPDNVAAAPGAVPPATDTPFDSAEDPQPAAAAATPAAEPTEPTEPADTAEPTETTEPMPDDGCSADNTSTDVAAGPVPTLDVRAESAANLLPDLAVRRINCAGGWVNLKNELPADRPVLVWFWAPH